MARKKQVNTDEVETIPASETSKTTTTSKKARTAKPKATAVSSSESKAARKTPVRRKSKTETTAESQTEQLGAAAVTVAGGSSQTHAAPSTPAIPWRRIDLHLHTPGSHDYEEPSKTYLDILRQAEKRGLSAIAFTDHNTVNGYRYMIGEIEHLEYLERLGRIHADELWRLNEYRRLMHKILVMPGFEFTATFGFHILGIFPPDKSLRDIERVLMDLRVPGNVLDSGLTEAGATSDVLAAYEAIDLAGGIAIAAHANSSNGVSMRGMNLGGQTRIAFTQDPHLSAIGFTDLEKGRHSSAHLFTGIKPEYPRRMHAIQGSDAHRLSMSKENSKRLGVGERPTEVQLEHVTFDALRELLRSQDWHRVRPVFTVAEVPDDALATARQSGPSATAAFHPSLPKRGDRFEPVLHDITAMANGEGGSIFIGCEAGTQKITGVSDAKQMTSALAEEVAKRVSPHLAPHIGLNDADAGHAQVVVIRVPAGTEAPYLLDSLHFLVREGTQSRLATREEIIVLARRGYEKIRPQQAVGGTQQRSQHESRRQPNQDTRQRPDQRERGGRQEGRDNRNFRDYRDNRQQGQQGPQGQQGQASDWRGQRTTASRDGQAQGQDRYQRGPLPSQQPGSSVDPNATANGSDVGAPEGLEAVDKAMHGVTGITGAGESAASDGATQMTASEGVSDQTPASPETASQAAVGTPAQNGNTTHSGSNARGNNAPVEPLLPGMPRTGVQVTTMDMRNGIEYFTVRDLRNNSMIRNVTRKSARDLWHYAVTQHAEHGGAYDPALIDWHGENGDRAVLSREVRAGKTRSDLAMLSEDSRVLVFYGVTDEGMDAEWKTLIADYEAARAVNVADEPEPEADLGVMDDEGFIDEPQPASLGAQPKKPLRPQQNRRRRGGRRDDALR